MTEMQTDISPLDFDVCCEYAKCDEAGVWISVLKCCGSTMIHCDRHLEETKEWAARGGLHYCPKCDKHNIEGSPFLFTEKIKR